MRLATKGFHAVIRHRVPIGQHDGVAVDAGNARRHGRLGPPPTRGAPNPPLLPIPFRSSQAAPITRACRLIDKREQGCRETAGGSDVVARRIAGELAKPLSQRIVIENKPGAGSPHHLALELFKERAD